MLPTKNDNARVGSWRVAANIGEIEVKCQQDAIVIRGGLEDRCVTFSRQSLARNIIDVMTLFGQHLFEVPRHVLVELELHAVNSVCSGCCSSS